MCFKVGFFTIIVQPTFTLMAELQPRVKVRLQNLNELSSR